MGNKFFLSISYLFHPLFMPFYCMLIMAGKPVSISNMFSEDNPWMFILLTLFVTTLLFPSFICWILLKTSLISGLLNPTGNDRRLLIGVCEFCYLLSYFIFFILHDFSWVASPLKLFLLGLNIAMFILFFVSLVTRVSIHATGAGGLMGLMTGLKRIDNISWFPLIVAASLIAFLICYSRYKLKAHNVQEIVLGYAIGILSVSIMFFTGF